MNPKLLKEATRVAKEVGHVFIATSDGEGRPHVATAGAFSGLTDGEVAVTEWFCPQTIRNLRINPRVSVVMWHPGRDEGYQILGMVGGIDEAAVMDGYDPELERQPLIPQVERRLRIHVDEVLRFVKGPHTDAAE